MTRMNSILQCKSQQINKYNSFKLRWTYRLTVSSLLYMVIMTRMGHHVLLSACQILLCHWFNLFGLVAKFCCAGARARPPSRDHVPRVLLAYTQRMRWRSGSRGGKKKKDRFEKIERRDIHSIALALVASPCSSMPTDPVAMLAS
jgi:hypothetical protein